MTHRWRDNIQWWKCRKIHFYFINALVFPVWKKTCNDLEEKSKRVATRNKSIFRSPKSTVTRTVSGPETKQWQGHLAVTKLHCQDLSATDQRNIYFIITLVHHTLLSFETTQYAIQTWGRVWGINASTNPSSFPWQAPWGAPRTLPCFQADCEACGIWKVQQRLFCPILSAHLKSDQHMMIGW